MPRRSPVKRRNKLKHLFVDDLEDPVLEARTSTTRIPIDWEPGVDGEDTPVFAMEHAYTEKQLEPYKAYPRLYQERKYMVQPMSQPFPFFALPPELRIEIYRYCLICAYPIDFVNLQFEIDWRDGIATHVLRTGRRINAEGSQVLCGDNNIRISQTDDLVGVPFILKNNFDWLNELTMTVPFMGRGPLLMHITTLQNAGNITSSQSIFKPRMSDDEETRLLRNVLDCIAMAPRLRRLHLVIHPWWQWPSYNDRTCIPGEEAPTDIVQAHLHDSDTWDDFKTLLEHKPTMEIAVTRLCYQFEEGDYREDHNVLLRKLRNKLGVWDQREATVHDWTLEWTMPSRTEVDPAVSMRDLQLLFGEI
ncbi:hypothetical protein FB567DRAFT_594493 [Paraphoma chrysanthemicola]|uniref:Uncharacterized protein n=1 Tax=Paraphoma chrysanthemicola TaxID=798071 RepID=A0A8K0VWH3_9PLEO|nr:hypothetical protein FB567DRAFT_594493 [Paraphoma chrysanthemicola]